MRILKLGQMLGGSNSPSGGWNPDDEDTLVAWYQKDTGITLSGDDVTTWTDSSANSNDMVQLDATEMPKWNAAGKYLEFDGAGENLQLSGSDISLSGNFTIGLKLSISVVGGTILASNTATGTGEWMRTISPTVLRIKIDNTTSVDLTLDSDTWGTGYLVLTRVSDEISMWWDGVLQSDTEEKSGTADINAIGVRKTDLNPLQGFMTEIQIYSISNSTLTGNVNTRLASI